MPINTKKDENMSVVDSIASAIRAYEFPSTPATNLIAAKNTLPTIPKTTDRDAISFAVFTGTKLTQKRGLSS